MPTSVLNLPQVGTHPVTWVWLPESAVLAPSAELISNIIIVDALSNPSLNTAFEFAFGYALRGFLFNDGPSSGVAFYYEVRFPNHQNVWHEIYEATASLDGFVDNTNSFAETTLGPFPEFRVRISNEDAINAANIDALFWIRSAQ